MKRGYERRGASVLVELVEAAEQQHRQRLRRTRKRRRGEDKQEEKEESLVAGHWWRPSREGRRSCKSKNRHGQ